jgi:ATP-dependent DNA ligase
MIDRPKFTEYTYEQIIEGDIPKRYDTFELKMDGIWGCMEVKDDEYNIYSRTYKIKKTGKMPEEEHDRVCGDHIFLGEFMKGSHWGHKIGLDGQFFIFDCLKYRGVDLSEYTLKQRRKYCSVWIENYRREGGGNWIEAIRKYSIDDLEYIWKHYVSDKAYEGVVLKDSLSAYGEDKAWARIKNRAEIEYMCIGFEPADKESRYNGQVGAVTGSLIDKPCQVQCGGLTDKQRMLFTKDPDYYMGRIFTATGHGYYPSGSLRHPKFGRWRDDKYVQQCTYDQIPEVIREC